MQYRVLKLESNSNKSSTPRNELKARNYNYTRELKDLDAVMEEVEELEALSSIFAEDVQWRKKESPTEKKQGYTVEVHMNKEVIATLELGGI